MAKEQPILWYPMRVTYQRELSVKAALDRMGIETFLPMRYQMVETDSGARRKLVPAIHNLLFVRSTRNTLTELKNTRQEMLPLRYMMRPALQDRPAEIITVPDKQMEDFIRVSKSNEDDIIYLEQSAFLAKKGKRVRIIEGPFAGVEGVIKRIKKNKHVVVQIADIAAVAITFVPTSNLSLIDDEESDS